MLSDGSFWDLAKWIGIHYKQAAQGPLNLQKLRILYNLSLSVILSWVLWASCLDEKKFPLT